MTGEEGTHFIYGTGTIKLTDTVEYNNLEAGKEYTVSGTLMDKTTKSEFLDKNGNKVTGKTTFTAKESDGTAEVTFEFDGSSMAEVRCTSRNALSQTEPTFISYIGSLGR